jgi:hypothetical protein
MVVVLVTYGCLRAPSGCSCWAAKHRRDSSSLRSAAPPSLGAGAGHSFLPPDRRLGRSATPSRSNLPWSAELPTPPEAKTPSFGGTGGLFGCHADCDCIIVYSAVSSTPMTDGRHASHLRYRRNTIYQYTDSPPAGMITKLQLFKSNNT